MTIPRSIAIVILQRGVTDLLEAPETWEDLARHAETLGDAFQQMRAWETAAKRST